MRISGESLTLLVHGHSFAYEMECVARLFYPGARMAVLAEGDSRQDNTLTAGIEETPEGYNLYAAVRIGDFQEENAAQLPADSSEKERERVLAVLLFRLLCRQTGIRPPWGILTGVRPVRFCGILRKRGLSEAEILRALTEDYLVFPDKAALALSTGEVQEQILRDSKPEDFSLYVGIPFCPSRCLYCSFVSHEIEKCEKLIPEYVKLLRKELEETAQIAEKLKLRLRAIYIGGGTPTTLSAGELSGIMGIIRERFDLSGLSEYTVEAGRPDTITEEKLTVIREMGADRISVNPQTMSDHVLREIGRRHTADQTLEAFRLAREAGFHAINMDLIAGLPGDTHESFRETVRQVMDLSPENITIHTLTVKRSSTLRQTDSAYDEPGMDVGEALDEARRKLADSGYMPYYMYRQKGSRQSLENIGYAKKGFESLYNIYVMEEARTVLAAGAGAVTKLCGPNGEIERVFNYKYPYEYISRFDGMMRRKAAVGEFYERYY